MVKFFRSSEKPSSKQTEEKIQENYFRRVATLLAKDIVASRRFKENPRFFQTDNPDEDQKTVEKEANKWMEIILRSGRGYLVSALIAGYSFDDNKYYLGGIRQDPNQEYYLPQMKWFTEEELVTWRVRAELLLGEEVFLRDPNQHILNTVRIPDPGLGLLGYIEKKGYVEFAYSCIGRKASGSRDPESRIDMSFALPRREAHQLLNELNEQPWLIDALYEKWALAALTTSQHASSRLPTEMEVRELRKHNRDQNRKMPVRPLYSDAKEIKIREYQEP